MVFVCQNFQDAGCLGFDCKHKNRTNTKEILRHVSRPLTDRHQMEVSPGGV